MLFLGPLPAIHRTSITVSLPGFTSHFAHFLGVLTQTLESQELSKVSQEGMC